jgi:4-carboxymuconolactone decarboxylase
LSAFPVLFTRKGTPLSQLAIHNIWLYLRIDQLYAQSPQDELHIQKHLSANCFGDYYTRTGLDVKTRELLTFSMLAALGGCEPQLLGHVAANISVGNDRRVLLDTVTQLLPFIGYPRTLNAIRVINEGTAR